MRTAVATDDGDDERPRRLRSGDLVLVLDDPRVEPELRGRVGIVSSDQRLRSERVVVEFFLAPSMVLIWADAVELIIPARAGMARLRASRSNLRDENLDVDEQLAARLEDLRRRVLPTERGGLPGATAHNVAGDQVGHFILAMFDLLVIGVPMLSRGDIVMVRPLPTVHADLHGRVGVVAGLSGRAGRCVNVLIDEDHPDESFRLFELQRVLSAELVERAKHRRR